MKKVIKIEGMTCNHCKASVEEALKSIDGIDDIVVNLEDKIANITIKNNKITDEIIKNAIEEIGFEVNSIESI